MTNKVAHESLQKLNEHLSRVRSDRVFEAAIHKLAEEFPEEILALETDRQDSRTTTMRIVKKFLHRNIFNFLCFVFAVRTRIEKMSLKLH